MIARYTQKFSKTFAIFQLGGHFIARPIPLSSTSTLSNLMQTLQIHVPTSGAASANAPAIGNQSANDAASDTPLARALEQNEAAAGAIKMSADELMIINAVLKQEIPEHSQIGDVAHALQKTDELEGKIQDTAQELAQVNVVLAQEIAERGELEDELLETKAELAKAIRKN